MTILNKFCCCLPLRTGCLIVAYSQMIFSVLATIGSFIVVCLSTPEVSFESSFNHISYTEHLRYPQLANTGISFIICIISLIFSSFLLHGALKSKASSIIIYIIYNLVTFIGWVIWIIVVIFLLTYWYGVAALVVGILVAVIVCGIPLYVIIFLYSYYLVLKKGELQDLLHVQPEQNVQYMEPAQHVQHTQPAQHVQYLYPAQYMQHVQPDEHVHIQNHM